MIKSLLAAALLCTSLSAAAQKKNDTPAFGKVENADLQIKECDFDPKASAYVLFDVAELYCNTSGGRVSMDMERHVRIKILSDKGLDQANIHLPFAFDETIKNLTAQTYNLDASGNISVSKLEKKQVFEKKLNKRYFEYAFSLPEVKAGSIIEYKYRQENVGLVDWYFQDDIPVKYSRYRTNFPVEIELFSAPSCVLPYESGRETKGNRDIMFYAMSNIPALRDEPYISCTQDYLQKVEIRPQAINTAMERVNLVRNWPGVIKGLLEDEDFGIQLKREIPRTADLDAELKKLTDPYQKMLAIHSYVRKNMEWNGYTSIWALDGVRSAWKDKKGTVGEINLILVNLLKDAGLSAAPILVSTKDNGRVSTMVAGINQFNKVMAYVTINEKVYVLDATEKYTPSGLIPLEVLASEGLVIEKPETFKWGWKPLWDNMHQIKDLIQVNAEINEKGEMKGNVMVLSYDYSRVQRLPVLKSGKDKLKEKFFTTDIAGFATDSFQVQNDDVDTLPLIQNANFSFPLSSSGEYKYFPVNLFTGLEKNPFVADNRFSDIFFGANQAYQLNAQITIPEGYEFETLPKNMRMIMPDTTIDMRRRFQVNGNLMMATISVEFKSPIYAVSDYDIFKEFFNKMSDMLNEQVAIRKKK